MGKMRKSAPDGEKAGQGDCAARGGAVYYYGGACKQDKMNAAVIAIDRFLRHFIWIPYAKAPAFPCRSNLPKHRRREAHMPQTPAEALRSLAARPAAPALIESRRALLRIRLCEAAPRLNAPDFPHLMPADLERAFALYDALFFEGFFARFYDGRMEFAFSNRMTRSAGLTIHARDFLRRPAAQRVITIKFSLDFLTGFARLPGGGTVGGLPAPDTLDALLLIAEHELCHAAEGVAFGRTSCAQPFFRALAKSLFGHTASTHALPSLSAAARAQSGLRPGDAVRFPHEGTALDGIVTSIHKRATVLVPDKRGGYAIRGRRGRFSKYLVPLELLTKNT